MLHPENLIPQSQRTPEQRREMAANGGRKSGQVRRRNRDIKKALLAMLGRDLPSKSGEKLTGAEGLATAMLKEALKGNPKHIQQILDLIYGRKQEVEMTSPDGSMTPKAATFDLSGFTPEQLIEMGKAVYRGE